MKKLLSAVLFLFAIACLSLTSCKKDRSIDPENEVEFAEYLADEMESQHMSAVSVLLFRENTVLYEQYFGQADRENNVALNANHIFLLASVSKTITATALMQLFENGQFGLDEDINNYLAFDVKHPDSDKAITFRMLLTHTSGIVDSDALDDQYYYGSDSPVNLADFMQGYLAVGGNNYDEKDNFAKFEPGDGYEYSNIGAALMGVLVEQISGEEFNAYCKTHIFQPLGMTNTFWHLSETDTTTIVRPYEYQHRDYEPLQHYTFTDYPNGGLRSNGLDLLKFCAAYANGGTYNGVQLLQNTTVNEMLQLQVSDLDETQGLSFYYGNIEEQLWGHEGAEQGVSTAIAFNTTNHTGGIILTNGTDCDLEDIMVSAYRLAQRL